MIKKEILDAYQWRHACKEFDKNKKISRDDWEFLLEIIRLSPSSFGLQPYEVLILNNKQILEELHPHMWGAQKQLFTASNVIAFITKNDVTVNDQYFEHILVDVQNTPDDLRDFRRNLINNHQINEIKIEENERYLSDWAGKQSYIALGNVMSAAAEIGIDSCPVEGFIKENVHNVLAKHKIIDISKHSVSAFCCFGYRLNNPVRDKARKPLIELVKIID